MGFIRFFFLISTLFSTVWGSNYFPCELIDTSAPGDTKVRANFSEFPEFVSIATSHLSTILVKPLFSRSNKDAMGNSHFIQIKNIVKRSSGQYEMELASDVNSDLHVFYKYRCIDSNTENATLGVAGVRNLEIHYNPKQYIVNTVRLKDIFPTLRDDSSLGLEYRLVGEQYLAIRVYKKNEKRIPIAFAIVSLKDQKVLYTTTDNFGVLADEKLIDLTISPNGQYLGMVMFTPPKSDSDRWGSQRLLVYDLSAEKIIPSEFLVAFKSASAFSRPRWEISNDASQGGGYLMRWGGPQNWIVNASSNNLVVWPKKAPDFAEKYFCNITDEGQLSPVFLERVEVMGILSAFNNKYRYFSLSCRGHRRLVILDIQKNVWLERHYDLSIVRTDIERELVIVEDDEISVMIAGYNPDRHDPKIKLFRLRRPDEPAPELLTEATTLKSFFRSIFSVNNNEVLYTEATVIGEHSHSTPRPWRSEVLLVKAELHPLGFSKRKTLFRVKYNDEWGPTPRYKVDFIPSNDSKYLVFVPTELELPEEVLFFQKR